MPPSDRPPAPRSAPPRRQWFVPAPDEAAAPARPAPPRPSPPRRPATPPAPPPGEPPATERGRGRPPRRRRPRRLRWLLLLPAALVVLLVLALVVAWSIFRGVERVEVGDALSTGGEGRNYLIVGSDSRQGTDDEAEVGGQRSDTLMLLRVGPDGSQQLMSIPRDLWVVDAEEGGEEKVNASYNRGPANLVRTVRGALGLPVHHYVEVDFVSFAGLVDALGGVVIDFPHPAFDQASGLEYTPAGPQRLSGPQALAYVRSRQYTEVIDGQEVRDPRGDLGRLERQQAFLRAVLGELGATRNPLTLRSAAGGLAAGLRIDDRMSFWGALGLAWRLRDFDPQTVELPTVPDRRRGQAVLLLDQPEAGDALARMGATAQPSAPSG